MVTKILDFALKNPFLLELSYKNRIRLTKKKIMLQYWVLNTVFRDGSRYHNYFWNISSFMWLNKEDKTSFYNSPKIDKMLPASTTHIKVQLFWERHKNLRNLSHGFDVYLMLKQNHEEDHSNFCGFLKKAEL